MALGIELEDVGFGYGKRDIFRHFSACWGEKTVIVGPNGSGKTTLLKIIGREIVPDSGIIRVGNRRDYRAMTLFDDDILFDHLTISSHFEWLRDVYRSDSAFLARIAEIFDLAPHWRRHPDALSGGQRRWCAIALALSVQADVYLFDEPLSVLDEFHKQRWFSIAGSWSKPIVATDQAQNCPQWPLPWRCERLAQ